VNYIWKDVPQNNIIKYFNNIFIKYLENKEWKIVTEKDIFQYILETLHNIYKEKADELIKNNYIKNLCGQSEKESEYNRAKYDNTGFKIGIKDQLKEDFKIN
jgi:iron-sulfur cluster repair protein YtfE (RIC family)